MKYTTHTYDFTFQGPDFPIRLCISDVPLLEEEVRRPEDDFVRTMDATTRDRLEQLCDEMARWLASEKSPGELYLLSYRTPASFVHERSR